MAMVGFGKASARPQPLPQQGEAQSNDVRETALQALHKAAAAALKGKTTGALQRFAGGHIGLNFGVAQLRKKDPGGDGCQPLPSSWIEQGMAGVELTPCPSHPLPAGDGLLRTCRFAKHLPLKGQDRIAAQHR